MKELRVPKLSLGDGDQMVVLEWTAEPGAEFAEGEVLLEVETDKATMEVDAPFAGVLAKQLVAVGETVEPGQLIGWVADPGEEYDPEALPGGEEDAPAAPAANGAPPAAQPAVAAGVAAAPSAGAVKLLPRDGGAPAPVEHGELRGIPAFPAPPPAPAAGAPAPAAPAPGPALDPDATGAHEVEPFSRHRAAIARTMSAAVTVPVFAAERFLPLAPALAALRALREEVPEATLTDVFLIAIAEALAAVPQVNAWCDGGSAIRFRDANVAIAVDGPEGVIAPVVRAVGSLEPAAVSAERGRLVGLAREGRIGGGDLAGATFSLSNIGPLGAHGLLPMLTLPQVAILALGAAREVGGEEAIKATFVGDHRALDGADGARFLGALAESLQSPTTTKGT